MKITFHTIDELRVILDLLRNQGAEIRAGEIEAAMPGDAPKFDNPRAAVESLISQNKTADQISIELKMTRKEVLEIISSMGLKMIFGQWRKKSGDAPADDKSVETVLSKNKRHIQHHCLDGYRLRSIAKNYNVSDEKMEEYINNELGLCWDEQQKRWLKQNKQ